MKKAIRNIIILSLLLIAISGAILFYFGRTYTIHFSLNDNHNCDVILENKKGSVEILEKKEEKNICKVTVKGKKEGKAFVELRHNDYSDIAVLYVHKAMIITENTFFGKATASEIIPISLSILLIYLLYLLIKEYFSSINENLYQYKNIAYLGIMIYLSFFTINTIRSIFHYNGLFETVNNIINSFSFVSLFLLPLAMTTFILVTISNIKLIQKEGKSWKNLLGLFLGIFLTLLSLLPNFAYDILMRIQIINIYNLNSIGPYLYNFIESLVFLSVSYLECILVGTIVIAIKAIKKKVSYDKDYIIILGCQIKKDGSLPPLLKGRVNRAIQFREEQLKETGKDLIFIPSGGKGEDEIISEAEAMKNYLIEEGIPTKNILIENQSKNTYENIKFSYQLIKNKRAKLSFSTTNYHVLRAGLLATEQEIKIEGMGSKTKAYFWINAFIREFIGTLYSEKKKHLIVILLSILLIVIMIMITYFANNL